MEIRLPKYVVERRGRYYVRRTRREDGRQRVTYTPIPHPLDAGFAAAYAEAIGEGTGPRAGTVGALISSYLESPEFARLSRSSEIQTRRALKRFGAAMGRFKPDDIQLRHIIAFRDAMADRPGEANNTIAKISTLYAWGLPRGYVTGNPAKGCPRLDTQDKSQPWPLEDVIRAVSEMRPEIAAGVALAFYTSQRKSDLIALTPAQMDGDGAWIQQRKTRRHKAAPVYVSFNVHALEILRELWPPDRDTPFLRHARGAWTPEGFRAAFVEERRRIGLSENREFRELRTTAATIVGQSDRPELAQALLGHADARTTRRYTRQANQRVAATAAAAIIPLLPRGGDNKTQKG